MTEPSLLAETIFAQALELESAAKREAFLDQACGDAPTLRAEIESLLRPTHGPEICSICRNGRSPSTCRASSGQALPSARTSWCKRSARAAWASSGWPSRHNLCAARWC